MLRMNPYNLTLSFPDYLDTLKDGLPYTFKPPVCLDMYSKIFTLITAMKSDYFNAGDYYVFLSQLLFGCRISEVSSLVISKDDKRLLVNINSLKGTGDRSLSFTISLPVIKTYIRLSETVYGCPSYKSYYRSLLKANPNLYQGLDMPHLTSTHLARHFYIQVLYYVLGLTRDQVQNVLSWKRDDTLDSYIDQHIWKPFKVGGEYGDLNNKHVEGLGDPPGRSSRTAGTNPRRRKVYKKKKVRKSEKE